MTCTQTKVIDSLILAKNWRFCVGVIFNQSPAINWTSSPSMMTLPLPDMIPYISSLFLWQWTKGTHSPAGRVLILISAPVKDSASCNYILALLEIFTFLHLDIL